MMTKLTRRLVLKCDREGHVLSVVGGSHVLRGAGGEPRRLPLLLDTASAAKCERFLQRVRMGGAFGWELNVNDAGRALALLFAGLPKSDGLWIAAAETHHALIVLLDELPALDAPEATLDVRSQPEVPAAFQTAGGHAGFLLDELTRVNSELLGLQRELAKRNAELTAITKQRNELLAIAAHDLRNPLLVVQGYCDLLGLSGGLTPSTQRELVNQVQHASELMLHILEDTLEYSRLENGRVEPHPVALDFVKLVQRAAEVHQPIAARKNIALVVRVTGRLPQLRLDATHMEQVVGNLLSNAIKYSDAGGRIDIVLSRDGDCVVLDVSDQGQGIAEAELALLFRPFQTTSARPTAGESSTGLGLAIVRKLVQANGGEISVRSSLHQGSTFSVRLPVARGSATQLAQGAGERRAPPLLGKRSRPNRGQS